MILFVILSYTCLNIFIQMKLCYHIFLLKMSFKEKRFEKKEFHRKEF
jgi:hypothetical protein